MFGRKQPGLQQLQPHYEFDSKAELAKGMTQVATAIGKLATAATSSSEAARHSAESTSKISDIVGYLVTKNNSIQDEKNLFTNNLHSAELLILDLKRKVRHRSYLIAILCLMGVSSIILNTIFLLRSAIGI